jgi:hypothetical protein
VPLITPGRESRLAVLWVPTSFYVLIFGVIVWQIVAVYRRVRMDA